MSYTFHDLDQNTRALMLEELRADKKRGVLFRGAVLSDDGWAAYPQLLEDALASGSPESLAQNLSGPGLLLSHTSTVKGPRRVGPDAAPRLAGGEFNRYYIRAVCRRALEEGIAHVTVYRARASQSPRPSSEDQVGVSLDAAQLLDDLRSNALTPGEVPIPNVNSGLSVHI